MNTGLVRYSDSHCILILVVIPPSGEKRSKANAEKERRRLEGELKIAQELVADMERNKRELEQTILRRDTEIQQMMTSLDDEQSGMNRIQRTIKELQARVEELEEELEAERQGRTKAERFVLKGIFINGVMQRERFVFGRHKYIKLRAWKHN